MDLREANDVAQRILGELGKAVVGQDAVLLEVTVAMLAGGHVLLEGVPAPPRR